VEVFGRNKITRYTRNRYEIAKHFDSFVGRIKNATWKTGADVRGTFPDADHIAGGAYIFNVLSSRSLAMVYFQDEEVEIVWVGNHDDYEATFRNNKRTIIKFLREKGFQV
jgi:mRNA-degrading endonuclease HigB of HigAB toxin-antitoxin module